eukprot:GHVR01053570.1.p1 GENE.GHVR01053570.1~~GHVR01053570.1.p1  ORF type:complete len:256 (+),score=31.54 GHVR01053570.1:290-1057(+)
MAVKMWQLCDEASLVWSASQEFCTEQTCPRMMAGTSEFRWKFDAPKKPGDSNPAVSLAAPRYMEEAIRGCLAKLKDERIFPTDPGIPFPPNFRELLMTHLKRLFRIYDHVYYNHFKDFQAQNAHPHLNHLFKHILFFILEFHLHDPIFIPRPDAPPDPTAQCHIFYPLRQLIDEVITTVITKNPDSDLERMQSDIKLFFASAGKKQKAVDNKGKELTPRGTTPRGAACVAPPPHLNIDRTTGHAKDSPRSQKQRS